MGVEGRKFVGARAKVRSDGGVRRGAGGHKYALMQAGVCGGGGVTISSQFCNSRVIAIG